MRYPGILLDERMGWGVDMKAVDKFGRKISEKTFKEIEKIGEKLSEIGYVESFGKPNLFRLSDGKITFFADLRGTRVVPIWENSRPLIYWHVNDKGARDDEQLIELLLEHCEKLYSQGVAWCFSFPETDEPGGYIYDHFGLIRKLSQIKFNDSEFIFGVEVSEPYDNPTKRCYFCRKLLASSNSFFCSDKHARQLYSRLMHERAIGLSDKIVRSCFICGQKETFTTNLDGRLSFQEFEREPVESLAIFTSGDIEMHHISRIPDRVIPLCSECHHKVHTELLRPDLKPEMTRREFFRARKKMSAARKREKRDRQWRNYMYGGVWRR